MTNTLSPRTRRFIILVDRVVLFITQHWLALAIISLTIFSGFADSRANSDARGHHHAGGSDLPRLQSHLPSTGVSQFLFLWRAERVHD
jgi:hypothetical protein